MAGLKHVERNYAEYSWGIAWGYSDECLDTCPVLTVKVHNTPAVKVDAACVNAALLEDGLPSTMFSVDDRRITF